MQQFTEPREFWIESGGVRLRGLDWGGLDGGVPVVMLHGIGDNAWYWNMLAPRLVDVLGASHRFVSIDQRGAGLSDKPPTGYGPLESGGDVVAVLNALGGGAGVLIGHSRGGWLSTYIGAHWPERVDRLVLVDPARIAYESVAAADAYYGSVRSGLGPFQSAEDAIAHFQEASPDGYWGPERKRAVLAGLHETFDGRVFGATPVWVLDELQRVRLEHDVVRAESTKIACPAALFVSSRRGEERRLQKLEYADVIPLIHIEFFDGTHHLHFDCADSLTTSIGAFLEAGRDELMKR